MLLLPLPLVACPGGRLLLLPGQRRVLLDGLRLVGAPHRCVLGVLGMIGTGVVASPEALGSRRLVTAGVPWREERQGLLGCRMGVHPLLVLKPGLLLMPGRRARGTSEVHLGHRCAAVSAELRAHGGGI